MLKRVMENKITEDAAVYIMLTYQKLKNETNVMTGLDIDFDWQPSGIYGFNSYDIFYEPDIEIKKIEYKNLFKRCFNCSEYKRGNLPDSFDKGHGHCRKFFTNVFAGSTGCPSFVQGKRTREFRTNNKYWKQG